MRTFKSIRAEFEMLRRRYYLDAEDPLLVPPAGTDPMLRWTWARNPREWAATHFDEDGDPHLIEVPFGLGARVTSLVLLHELSHMRNPRAECGRRADRWWRAEGRRLEAAGAFSREGIF
jgi:hypothetical protein